VWGPSPTDPDGDHGSLKVLTRAKMNLARGSASAAFQIEEAVIENGIRVPRLTHIGESDARAEDVTADQVTRTQTAAAMHFLRDQLADGPQEAEAVKAAADAADITSKCLRIARERLVHSYRPGGNHGPYAWELRSPTKGKGIQGHSGASTTVNALDALDAHIFTDGSSDQADHDLQTLLVAFAAGVPDGAASGHGDWTDDELQALVSAEGSES
jgi:hypothetical protein